MASRNLDDCVVELQEKVPKIIEEFNSNNPGLELRVICTLRSTAEQQKLYAIGRSTGKIGRKYIVTNIDGIKKFSNHNPTPKINKSRAVDFGIFSNGEYIRETGPYKQLVNLANKYGLVSGGSWITIKDFPHIEIKNAQKFI